LNTTINPNKILVIRFSSLGDVVLTTAIYPNLKLKWPETELTVLTKAPYAPVFANNPHVNHVQIYDSHIQSFSELAAEIKKEKFDVIIDLQGNFRSWWIRFLSGAPLTVVVRKNMWARYFLLYFKRSLASLQKSFRERVLDTLAALDVPIKNTETELFVKNNDSLLSTYGILPTLKLIGIAPGAKHKTKMWGVDKFTEAANRLAAGGGAQIIILGDKSDRPVCDEIAKNITVPYVNLAGWTNLEDLSFVVSKLNFLLTNDSGLMHMGEAHKIPLVALFGPTVRSFGFAPYRTTSRVAEVELPCRPCTLHGSEKCPLSHHMCMTELDVNAVLFVASALLDPSLA
jgi:heptosyltransferase-2